MNLEKKKILNSIKSIKRFTNRMEKREEARTSESNFIENDMSDETTVSSSFSFSWNMQEWQSQNIDKQAEIM